jgi:DeoR family suf operon transcriptional repressor
MSTAMTTQLDASHDQPNPPGPTGHRGTRAAVLLQLKRDGVATAASIAGALDCSLNTIRHHLKELEADALVMYERVPHGVGAPAHAYKLTDKGHGLFPDRYADTVARLLDHVVQLQGREASVELLQRHYGALGERLCAETAEIVHEHRGEHIARALDREGFMATWVASDNGGTLTEHNCPHRVVAERFPEVCADEEAFLARAFGATVTRQSHIAAGCGCCSYHVAISPPAAGDAS